MSLTLRDHSVINTSAASPLHQEQPTQLTEIENIYIKTSFDSPVTSSLSTPGTRGSVACVSGATSCLNSVQNKLMSLLVEDSKCLASVSEPDVCSQKYKYDVIQISTTVFSYLNSFNMGNILLAFEFRGLMVKIKL